MEKDTPNRASVSMPKETPKLEGLPILEGLVELQAYKFGIKWNERYLTLTPYHLKRRNIGSKYQWKEDYDIDLRLIVDAVVLDTTMQEGVFEFKDEKGRLFRIRPKCQAELKYLGTRVKNFMSSKELAETWKNKINSARAFQQGYACHKIGYYNKAIESYNLFVALEEKTPIIPGITCSSMSDFNAISYNELSSAFYLIGICHFFPQSV